MSKNRKLKIRTESSTLGVLKISLVFLLLIAQFTFFILLRNYLINLYSGLLAVSLIVSFILCVYVLSSNYDSQSKALWIFFLLTCFSFAHIVYFLSNKKVVFSNYSKRYKKLQNAHKDLCKQIDLVSTDKNTITNCNYLYNVGQFVASTQSKTTYYSSGNSLFESICVELEKAERFIFLEYYIISDGILFEKIYKILKQKVEQGVEVRIIYDDIGCHRLKRKSIKKLKKSGIKVHAFNRLTPTFNFALNYRDHRKLVVIDGKVAFTGGANLADEYINKNLKFGYWKDCGIKIEGNAVDNFTIAILNQWSFVEKTNLEYNQYLNLADNYESDGVVVPFVSGPNFAQSVEKNMYINLISEAKEKIYIMTPYFVPDETLINLLTIKAQSGVDVRIILPETVDKKFVYVLTRNNAEKLFMQGVKVYTMNESFVHSKVILTEKSVIVGTINFDLRSFNQQFESAVYTNEQATLDAVNNDFKNTMDDSQKLTQQTLKRNKLSFRILAGLFNLVSPFM